MLNEEIKVALKKFGFFFASIAVFAAFTLTLSIVSRSSWEKGLAVSMQDTLNKFYPDTYVVENFIRVNSSLSVSSALYEVKSKRGRTSELNYTGIIIRIPSITGLEPAVFLYNKNRGMQFIGYAVPYGKDTPLFDPENNRAVISYWEKQLPYLIEKAGIK